MKRIFILVAFLIANCQLSIINAGVFSDSTVISLLTCSPSEAVYARFGHTALRFYDKTQNIDVVFNYGLFDLESDDFILKFVKGWTYYQLGAGSTASMFYEYELKNSSVTEQVLNLTAAERHRIIDLVLENYEPQNRTYLYSFVFDNCATRPFYKIQEGLGCKILIDTLAEQYTFRQWIETYAEADKWLMFGIDLVFGADADRFCTAEQSLFLPEVLMYQMNRAKIIGADGEKNIVNSTKTLLKTVPQIESGNSIFTPHFVNILILLMLGLLAVWFIKIKKGLRWLVFALMIASGLAGIIVGYLMFFSIHPLVHHNWNVLWCNPFNLVAAFLIIPQKLQKFMRWYVLLCAVLLAALAVVAIFKVQVFNSAVFPLWILLGFVYFYFTKNAFQK